MTVAYESWAAYYQAHADKVQVPESFVARVFLSRQPVELLPSYDFVGRRILDLGCGDGRHAWFFAALGFEVSGCELAEEQVLRLRDRLPGDFRVGRASALPFADEAFDTLAAVNSVYYLDPGGAITDNLAEAARVTRPGGTLVLSFVGRDHFLLREGEAHADGSFTLATDPIGVRIGARIRPAWSEDDLRGLFAFDPRLRVHQIGEIRDTCAGRCRHLHYLTVGKA